jgi:dTDP-4-dehydrorhamnose reductase
VRVAILGASGQLGTDLVRVFSSEGRYEVHGFAHEDVEVTDMASLRTALTGSNPEVVINTAAFHRVDECEDNPEKAFQVNAIGALNVARLCRDLGAVCVYISTDYVFSGEKECPYTEEDTPDPINVYGTSKLAGEYLVRQAAPQWIVARVASLFGVAGARGKGGNFVGTILRKARAGESLRVVDDMRMSPTYTVDAARALEVIIRAGETGVFHVTNQGECSWYEFACAIVALAGIKVQIERVSSREYPRPARRPTRSALGSVRLPDEARDMLRPWDEALRAYLRACELISVFRAGREWKGPSFSEL